MDFLLNEENSNDPKRIIHDIINWNMKLAREPLLAEGDGVGVTEQDWDALKDRLWSHYETTGYQGERFIYQADFDTALDVARKELARYPRYRPVPAEERMPIAADCDMWGRCWLEMNSFIGDTIIPRWSLECPLDVLGWSSWLPAAAIPLPEEPGD